MFIPKMPTDSIMRDPTITGTRYCDSENRICYYRPHTPDGTTHPCVNLATNECVGIPDEYLTDGSYWWHTVPHYSYYGGMPELYTEDSNNPGTYTVDEEHVEYFSGLQHDHRLNGTTFLDWQSGKQMNDETRRQRFAWKEGLCRWCMIFKVKIPRQLPPNERPKTNVL